MDARDITEAGLFDRENLDLPFSSENNLVALLGDSSHSQTPLLGQGVNMAIADAYVYATNIAVAQKNKTSPREAILQSTTPTATRAPRRPSRWLASCASSSRRRIVSYAGSCTSCANTRPPVPLWARSTTATKATATF